MNNIKSLMLLSLMVFFTSAFSEERAVIARVSGTVALTKMSGQENFDIHITCKLCMDENRGLDCVNAGGWSANGVVELTRPNMDAAMAGEEVIREWTVEFNVNQPRINQQHMNGQTMCTVHDLRGPDNLAWVEGNFN